MNEQLISRVEKDASMNGWEILTELPSSEPLESDEYEEEYEDSYHSDASERLEAKEDNLGFFSIDLPSEFFDRYDFLNHLPSGVAVMGGVARSIAREIIAGDLEPIRDIDLVNIVNESGESQNSDDLLDELARTYMPDDYAYGHGIENDTLDNYFKTRDFTVNQSLILDGKLIVSSLAYNDLQENIIRPTYYSLPSFDEGLSGRLFMKGLMMVSALKECCSSIPTTEDFKIEDTAQDNFNATLFLNKAMGRGAQVALNFTDQLADYEVIPERLRHRPKAAAKYLLSDYQMRYFELRQTADEAFQEKLDYVIPPQSTANTKQYSLPRPPINADDYDEYDHLSNQELYDSANQPAHDSLVPDAMRNFASPNRSIRNAMAEYDDHYIPKYHDDPEDWDMDSSNSTPPPEWLSDFYYQNHSHLIDHIIEDTEEIYSGRYSDADFEEINNYFNQSIHHPDYDDYRQRIVFWNNDGDYDEDDDNFEDIIEDDEFNEDTSNENY